PLRPTGPSPRTRGRLADVSARFTDACPRRRSLATRGDSTSGHLRVRESGGPAPDGRGWPGLERVAGSGGRARSAASAPPARGAVRLEDAPRHWTSIAGGPACRGGPAAGGGDVCVGVGERVGAAG